MNEIITRTLQDLKARQDKGEHMVCPRCGKDTMNTTILRNALSRHADIHICDNCGKAEALLAMMRNPLPLSLWACVRDDRPHGDFKALSGEAALEQLRKAQIPFLTRLYERWQADAASGDFEAYRLEAHRECPGLDALWSQPFQAAYQVADGQLLIRFRATGTGVEIATDLIPKR